MAISMRLSTGLIDRVKCPVSSILRIALKPIAIQSQFRHASPFSQLAVPSSFPLELPTLLEDIWESILRAVPKKKTSHRKKRQRFLAGKSLKNEIALNKCPACGNVKKAHFLCPWCVREIQDMWKGKETKATAEAK